MLRFILGKFVRPLMLLIPGGVRLQAIISVLKEREWKEFHGQSEEKEN